MPSAESSQQRGSCELHICSARKRWITETSGETQAAGPVCSEAALQDGGDSAGQGPVEEGGLYGVHRPERRLPVGANSKRAQESVFSGGQAL